MQCAFCTKPLAGDAFPGAEVRCEACGAPNRIDGKAEVAPEGPYRHAEARAELAREPLACPSCGAATFEEARECAECHAELATIRCTYCFTLQFAATSACRHCGRELELEALPDLSTASCPRCTHKLARVGDGESGMQECPGCGGIFVDKATLAQIVTEHDLPRAEAPLHPPTPVSNDGHVAVSGRSWPTSRFDHEVHYIRCPICLAQMNRTNFGKRSGIIVDVCARHGTWFDPGELTNIVEFLEGGGLAYTRKHDALNAEEERRARADHTGESRDVLTGQSRLADFLRALGTKE